MALMATNMEEVLSDKVNLLAELEAQAEGRLALQRKVKALKQVGGGGRRREAACGDECGGARAHWWAQWGW
jgi:hypothetical protein